MEVPREAARMSATGLLQDTPDFSIVLGGPLFQLFRRAHLSDGALHMVNRRVMVIALICWLPLLVLSAADGQFLGGRAAVPFLWDIDVHVRFLIVVPLLVGAETVVHQRMRNLVKIFLDRRLIPESAMTRFREAIDGAFRLRNSVLAEVLLLLFVYVVGVFVVWRHFIALDAATWYATPSADGPRYSLAGLWYGYVSLPVFQFLLARWYFRFFIWSRFLLQVSRMDLCLVPTNPDRAGGLGFLTGMMHAFVPILLAHGALLAGSLANRIFYLHASLVSFKTEVIVLTVFLLLVVTGPLLVFTPLLSRTKRTARYEYGTLAQRYGREFDTKWLRGGAAPEEPLLGAADIQSLADMENSMDVVSTMRVTLITKDVFTVLGGSVIAPVLPLALTLMPLGELLKKVAGILI
jgi:hypothetical protein